MKAKIESMQHDSCNLRDFFLTEEYVIVAKTTGPENRQIRLKIEGNVIKDPLFKGDQADWEYELEITIKGKPKSQQSLIVLS